MHANADSHPLQPNHLNKISFYALIDHKLIDVFKVKNILLITNSLFFFLKCEWGWEEACGQYFIEI